MKEEQKKYFTLGGEGGGWRGRPQGFGGEESGGWQDREGVNFTNHLICRKRCPVLRNIIIFNTALRRGVG